MASLLFFWLQYCGDGWFDASTAMHSKTDLRQQLPFRQVTPLCSQADWHLVLVTVCLTTDCCCLHPAKKCSLITILCSVCSGLQIGNILVCAQRKMVSICKLTVSYTVDILPYNAVVRGFLARRKYRPQLKRRRSAIVKLQAYLRGYQERQRYRGYRKQAVHSAVRIQSGWYSCPCLHCQWLFLEQSNWNGSVAYSRIQVTTDDTEVWVSYSQAQNVPVFRGYLARRQVEKIRMSQDASCGQAAIILQKYFRMWKAQSQLVKLQLQQIHNDSERRAFTEGVWSACVCHFTTTPPTTFCVSKIEQLPPHVSALPPGGASRQTRHSKLGANKYSCDWGRPESPSSWNELSLERRQTGSNEKIAWDKGLVDRGRITVLWLREWQKMAAVQPGRVGIIIIIVFTKLEPLNLAKESCGGFYFSCLGQIKKRAVASGTRKKGAFPFSKQCHFFLFSVPMVWDTILSIMSHLTLNHLHYTFSKLKRLASASLIYYDKIAAESKDRSVPGHYCVPSANSTPN